MPVVGIEEARRVVLAGGVVGLPAEGSYGLSARADAAEPLAAISQRKGSRPGRSFLVAAGDAASLRSLPLELPGRLAERLLALWPAPLTVVLRLRSPLPADAGGTGTLGVRIPADGILRGAAHPLPIVTTSANREGEPPAKSAAELLAIWPDLPVVDGGERPGGTPSTILDLTQKAPRVLRDGAFRVGEELLLDLAAAAGAE